MRWKDLRRSENVEDRRGMRRPMMIAGGGIGTVVVVLLIALLGGDPGAILQNQPPGSGFNEPAPPPADADEMAQFVSAVLGSTEEVWDEQFRQMGSTYRPPKLILFSGQVQSACGFASAAVGPFYCPGDQQVYIDLSFYDMLKQRFGAPGDFAQAYVIAHEVGHHVQNLLGEADKLDRARRTLSEAEFNKHLVRFELQADFYAGVWAHHADKMRGVLESGDLEEALNAAQAIGDDNIQRQTQGYVVPESFTHGTSAQRMRWFRKGFETGDIRQGDTFSVPEP
jgi:predicted metalloprotease